ncbi:hypothetical protein L1049_010011 [Liquidambar formosana]|uniref:Uncharacterized protein n=1 Tax=Liquidambar formosana TaxID=63359 RepID=A0AAP0R4I2_LIQFO
MKQGKLRSNQLTNYKSRRKLHKVKPLKEELGYDEAFNYNTETDATLGKRATTAEMLLRREEQRENGGMRGRPRQRESTAVGGVYAGVDGVEQC